MNKRLLSLLLAAICLLSAWVCPVGAETAEQQTTYIAYYTADLAPGTQAGTIRVSYSVSAYGTMSYIGVSKIVVYRADGTKYKTVLGNVANGLLETNDYTASGSYQITCVAGESYYCKVTLYASLGSNYDSVTVQTANVTAPLVSISCPAP